MPTVDCSEDGWGFTLFSYLSERHDVELINAYFEKAFFDDLATRFSMEVEFDHYKGLARFRNLHQ